MTNKLKSWMTNPFFEIILWAGEIIVHNNYLYQKLLL